MELSEALKRRIIFVQGKGGVGKTTVARALAETLAKRGKRTLFVVIEDPQLPPGEIQRLGTNLDRLNCEPASAFEQYAAIRIGSGLVAKLFTQNKLMRYMVQAAPGIKELTVMGKIWHERKNYDHVVVDMPATGHGITLFTAIQNWRNLFSGSPLEKDAREMTETFSDPQQVSHVIVALPEEMPMVEALELEANLKKIHPNTESVFVLNRSFPRENLSLRDPSLERRPFAGDLLSHLELRAGMEEKNEALWKGKSPFRIPYHAEGSQEGVVSRTREHFDRSLSSDASPGGARS